MQGTPSCLTCPPPESHQPCSSDSELRVPQTIAMAHIATCMRPDAHKPSVYISQETSSRMSVSVHHPPPTIPMNQQLLRRSSSLKDLQTTRDTSTSSAPLTKSPSLASIAQPNITPKYQLWPSSKSPVGQLRTNHSSDKLAALSVGRSSTSLSDTAVLPESVPFWQRTGSLSRRRKVSVPELGNTMTTVQEMAIDSRRTQQCLHLEEVILMMSSYYPWPTSPS